MIGSDTMSRIIDYTDRSTCILFGDGAGAMLIEPTEDGEPGFIDFVNQIDGSGGDYLKQPAGGSRLPASAETVAQRLHYVKQDGQQVFKYAVRKMEECSRALLERNGLSVDDVAVMIPHQANRRIIAAAAERLGINCDRVVINIDQYGEWAGAALFALMPHAMLCSAGSSRRQILVLLRQEQWARATPGGRELCALLANVGYLDSGRSVCKRESGGVRMPRATWHRSGTGAFRARIFGSGI